MMNIPEVKLGIVAVSRNCFPKAIAEGRRLAIAEKAIAEGITIYSYPIVVETEVDVIRAVDQLKDNSVNALVVFLGNFGPETPETLLAKYFDGPVMFCAAAEESVSILKTDRGDALCGLLNCSYNMALRNINGYIPPIPFGDADAIVKMIKQFIPIARALIGVKNLKIVTFGPRPEEFITCNAPIQPLYKLGVEISENSELDLLKAYQSHENDPRIKEILKDMCEELNLSEPKARMEKMAQYELTLLDLADQLKGSRNYIAFANKCWPAFKEYFGFFPCYVNSRLTSKGIPVACEVDVYGALSEYIGACITNDAVTLLDINNTVPAEQYDTYIRGKFDYTSDEVFMGFHCGNTPSCKLVEPNLTHHLILGRDLEDKSSCMGTIEGDLLPGDMTFFRLHSTADCKLIAYAAQGEILPVPTQSFGSIGIIAIPEMARFYRNVLLEKHFPHHAAVAFNRIGASLWEVFKLLGVTDISFNHPKGLLYPSENPFS